MIEGQAKVVSTADRQVIVLLQVSENLLFSVNQPFSETENVVFLSEEPKNHSEDFKIFQRISKYGEAILQSQRG